MAPVSSLVVAALAVLSLAAAGAPPTPRQDPDCPPVQPFSASVSQGYLTQKEQVVLTTATTGGCGGFASHFWITGSSQDIDWAVISYYVDGETTPSIQFQPALACGVGFGDEQAPWGTKWIGKGAATGGWFSNIKIPFSKSLNVTARMPDGYSDLSFYMIVRGTLNKPSMTVGDLSFFSAQTRLTLSVTNASFAPLNWVPLANIPAGTSGSLFATSLFVVSGNLNFLEGCFHAYTSSGMQFPGLIISTGTEDYFDSAYYFNAGEFHLPVAGFTHYDNTNGVVRFSAYRFHEMDSLVFSDGLRFVWRNGDASDPKTGLKCTIDQGGVPNGSPTQSQVAAYTWVYVCSGSSPCFN